MRLFGAFVACGFLTWVAILGLTTQSVKEFSTWRVTCLRILMRLIAAHEDPATWCYHNGKLVKILVSIIKYTNYRTP